MLVISLLIFRIVLLILGLGLLAMIGYIMFSFRNVVPFVPTPRKIVRKMVEKADVKDGERIVDLGSGTGRIIIYAAKIYQKNLIIGIEKSFILRLITKFCLIFHPLIRQRIQVMNENFFNLDLRQFDVIFCFLTPEALRRLASKFNFLKSGSRIVCYMFPLGNYEDFTEQVEHVTSKDAIYLFTKK